MEIAPALRKAVGSGDFAALAELLATDAALDTSSERGRFLVRGREEIVAHLSGPGPGEVTHWDAREWDTGAAITFEWRGPDGPDRRRWYVRRDSEGITTLNSYAARPKGGAVEDVQIPGEVLDRLGAGARREPLDHSGNSGAALERVVLGDGTRLIAKRVGPGADWLGRVTNDRGRTALLWEAGAFERMPAELDHGIESVVEDGEGWWVVMRDLSATFLDEDRRISRAESRRVLDAAAAMHATFSGVVPDGPATLTDRIGMASLAVAEAERSGPDLLPKQLDAAWDAFAESVPQDVAGQVMKAVRDPSLLPGRLESTGPLTLLHGDLRDENLGLTDDRIVLLDWDLATAGTPTVEFAWYLCHDAWRTDATHDELEQDFREAEGERLDPAETELGMLSGLVQYGWIFGHSLRVHPDPAERAWAEEELRWWVSRTRRALEATGGLA